ncbi:MAG: F0F1 ATP synthase subunit B, partial [Flavobacteriales bacterium]
RCRSQYILMAGGSMVQNQYPASRPPAMASGGKRSSDARQAIATERKAAVAELKAEVAKLSVAIAEQLVRAELSNDDKQKELVTKLIEESPLN